MTSALEKYAQSSVPRYTSYPTAAQFHTGVGPDQQRDWLRDLNETSATLYLHVPFCSVRCGYCDFNTYTADELGPGVARGDYAATAVEEVRLARRVLGAVDRPVDTVFVGGGTPTLLAPDDLGRLLGAVRDEFGLADDVEVTTEANPDSVTPEGLQRLRELGFTRISFGMQSQVAHVLRVLDRTHDPRRVPEAVAWAREAGFEQVSLDLIYGTPGETLADWEASVRAASRLSRRRSFSSPAALTAMATNDRLPLGICKVTTRSVVSTQSATLPWPRVSGCLTPSSRASCWMAGAKSAAVSSSCCGAASRPIGSNSEPYSRLRRLEAVVLADAWRQLV